MIRINLLPHELRHAAGTSPMLLGIIFSGVALVAAVGFFYVYLWFNLLIVEEDLTRLNHEVTQLKSQAAEVDSLQEDLADYKERERIIVQFKTGRILWSRKLDELIRLTPPEVWILQLRVKQDTPARGTPGAQPVKYLELECSALGADVKTMTEFRGNLMGQVDFWRDFLTEGVAPNDFSYGFAGISPPSWEKISLDGFREQENIRFTIRLNLKANEGAAAAQKAT